MYDKHDIFFLCFILSFQKKDLYPKNNKPCRASGIESREAGLSLTDNGDLLIFAIYYTELNMPFL